MTYNFLSDYLILELNSYYTPKLIHFGLVLEAKQIFLIGFGISLFGVVLDLATTSLIGDKPRFWFYLF